MMILPLTGSHNPESSTNEPNFLRIVSEIFISLILLGLPPISGADDVTRDFELELTDLIGKVVEEILKGR